MLRETTKVSSITQLNCAMKRRQTSPVVIIVVILLVISISIWTLCSVYIDWRRAEERRIQMRWTKCQAVCVNQRCWTLYFCFDYWNEQGRKEETCVRIGECAREKLNANCVMLSRTSSCSLIKDAGKLSLWYQISVKLHWSSMGWNVKTKTFPPWIFTSFNLFRASIS